MKYNYKKQIIEGVEYKYSAEWIYDLESEEHWRLYWNQQKLMQNKVSSGDNVLEIAVGSGFTANYLKSKSINVKTTPEARPAIFTHGKHFQQDKNIFHRKKR